MKIKIYKN